MPRDPVAKVEELAAQVERTMGDNLRSLVLYGSAARGDFDPKRSDFNLLLIVREASPAALRPLGSAIGKWAAAGQPPPLILTTHDWETCTDVFPMELEDMRQAHRLLRGEDPFPGMETSPADLRDELEREARGKLIHLRAEYAATEADGRALGELLLASAKAFFVLFRAVVRLQGHVPPRQPAELVRLTAHAAGVDASAFDWVLARTAGQKVPGLQPYDPIGERYLEAIERVVRFVDEMD